MASSIIKKIGASYPLTHNIDLMQYTSSNYFETPVDSWLVVIMGHGTGRLTIAGNNSYISWKFWEENIKDHDEIRTFFIPTHTRLWISYDDTTSSVTQVFIRY